MNMNTNRSLMLAAALATALGTTAARADGDLDTTFNDGTGTRIVQFDGTIGAGSADTGRKVLIDKNNRIYMIGTAEETGVSPNRHFAVTRLGGLGDQAGQGDLAFGFFGGATTPDSTGNITATSAAFDKNGNIVVAGFKNLSISNYDFFTCVFSPAGTLGNCVRPVFDVGNGERHIDVANDIVVDSQNRVLLAGFSECLTQSVCGAIVRLKPDGTPDKTFGVDGTGYSVIVGEDDPPITPFDHRLTTMTLDNQGRILLAGTYRDKTNDTYTKVIVERLTPNGVRDMSWSQDGLLVASLEALVPDSGNARATDIVFDERDNSILVTGTVIKDTSNGKAAGFVIKLSTFGTAIPTFNMDGFALYDAFDSTTIESIARTHDGNYVLGGSATEINGEEFLLQKISYTNGQYIPAYGVSGRRRVDINNLGDNDSGVSVAISPYHDFTVLVGTTPVTGGQSTNKGFSIARLDSDVIFYNEFED